MLRKILEKVFITNIFTQCKTSRTLKIDVFKIPDNSNIRKLFSKHVLIHLKYWYCNSPYLELLCLSHHPCQILPKPTETPLQHNPHYVLHRFPYFALTHLTTHHHKYLKYPIICQSKPIKFNIKLYTDHNALWVKLATHQKAASLRAASLSKLGNTVNSKMVGAPSFSQL